MKGYKGEGGKLGMGLDMGGVMIKLVRKSDSLPVWCLLLVISADQRHTLLMTCAVVTIEQVMVSCQMSPVNINISSSNL